MTSKSYIDLYAYNKFRKLIDKKSHKEIFEICDKIGTSSEVPKIITFEEFYSYDKLNCDEAENYIKRLKPLIMSGNEDEFNLIKFYIIEDLKDKNKVVSKNYIIKKFIKLLDLYYFSDNLIKSIIISKE